MKNIYKNLNLKTLSLTAHWVTYITLLDMYFVLLFVI